MSETTDRAELIAWLRKEFGDRAVSWRGSDLGEAFARHIDAADLLEADAAEIAKVTAQCLVEAAIVGRLDRRCDELEALVRRLVVNEQGSTSHRYIAERVEILKAAQSLLNPTEKQS